MLIVRKYKDLGFSKDKKKKRGNIFQIKNWEEGCIYPYIRIYPRRGLNISMCEVRGRKDMLNLQSLNLKEQDVILLVLNLVALWPTSGRMGSVVRRKDRSWLQTLTSPSRKDTRGKVYSSFILFYTRVSRHLIFSQKKKDVNR